jgi:photosystem II stability/assembly factor-like uncharacterized protein
MRVFLLLLIMPVLLFGQADVDLPGLKWRNVGPANQGGRIVDVEALDGQFRKVWMATGSGGVWYSENAGTTWTPIFDDYSTASIGDIAVYQQDPSIIWVGTGESNNRNSLSWGDGVFRSTDGGKTFENVGLHSTHHIGRVITIPDQPESACVCAVGHLWGTTGNRGLFKTDDGGQSWEKLTNGLPNDGKTGCTDLVIDPNNSKVMYAAFYERLRKPWNFQSGGPNGGIFKTDDGGKSWTKLTNGLPPGPTGRIGLAIYKKDPKILMALVEAEQTDTLAIPGSGLYRSENGGENWTYVNTYNNRPFYYSNVRINPHDHQRVYVLTTRFMVSEDGGKTLRDGSADQEVHGDFHAMWLDPNDPDRYYLGADKGISITHDHGKKFQLFDNLPIAQFYRIGLDHQDPFTIYGGLQDNGFYATASFTRDVRGILNDSNWKVHWGDGQYTAIDPDDPRTVYTSSENGRLNLYDPLTHRIKRISPSTSNITNYEDYYDRSGSKPGGYLRFNWSSPFKMVPSKNIYYAGNHVFKSVDRGKSWEIISPDLSSNDPEKTRYRASGGITPDNTGAEIHCTITTLSLSPTDENVIWAGTDDGRVHVTRDGGKTWNHVHDELEVGAENLWISRIEASAHQPGRAYLTIDGHRSDHHAPYVFVTEDFGQSWWPIVANLPASEVVRVIREDIVNPDLLYIGTETGIWFSLDRGEGWSRLMQGMPTVSVYDLAIHPRDQSLVAGTHGRSLFVLDHTQPLQQLTREVVASDIHLFDQPVATLWENVSRGGQRGHFWYAGENPDVIRPTSSLARARFQVDVPIYFWVGTKDSTTVTLTIERGAESFTTEVDAAPGVNKYLWNRRFDPRPYTAEEERAILEAFQAMEEQDDFIKRRYQDYLAAGEAIQEKRRIVDRVAEELGLNANLGIVSAGEGEYRVSLSFGSTTQTKKLSIRKDPLLED